MENSVEDGREQTPKKRKHEEVRDAVGYNQQSSRNRTGQNSTRPAATSFSPLFLPGSVCHQQKQLESSVLPPFHDINAVKTPKIPHHAFPKQSTVIPEVSHEMRGENGDKHGRLHKSKQVGQRAEIYAPVQGTQYNLLEIESSPEQVTRIKSPKYKRKRFYAVAAGHVPGIYKNWEDAERQIKGYSGAKQKGFMSEAEAQAWLNDHRMFSKPPLSFGGGFQKKPAVPVQTQHFPTSVQSTTSTRLADEYLFPSGGLAEPKIPNGGGLQRQSDISSLALSPPKLHTAAMLQMKDTEPFDSEPVLRPEQQHVVDLILQGRNVFYTGSAGCGKSTILKAFVKQLQLQGKRVKIVAPTNLAALNVGGMTTWSFAGWTPASMKRPLDKLMQAAHGKNIWERFDSTDVLVIDEISMVENLLFERLNKVMTASREQKSGGGPFGGVQLIVTGDFCQLSPVRPFQHCIGCGWELERDNNFSPKEYRCENNKCCENVFYDIDKWAFRSRAWEECNFKHINLTEIHRQSDRKFISILQKIRTDGIILPPHANVLLNHTSETEGAIQLFARRIDVDRINNDNIARLPVEARTYKCVDHFDWKAHHRDDTNMEKNSRCANDGTLLALREHRYDVNVQLKENMRIVLQANIEPALGLVNGSQGTIIGFEEFDEARLPRKPEGRNETSINFTRGEHAAYIEGQVRIFGKENNRLPWPIVRFDNGLTRTIYADCTASELGNDEPYSLLSRTQIPLTAGYAITVHKSQGMTLDRVIVDLSRAFEPSQIYVALSRARSLMGLKVLGLPQSNLGGANEQVKEFFEKYLRKTEP